MAANCIVHLLFIVRSNQSASWPTIGAIHPASSTPEARLWQAHANAQPLQLSVTARRVLLRFSEAIAKLRKSGSAGKPCPRTPAARARFGLARISSSWPRNAVRHIERRKGWPLFATHQLTRWEIEKLAVP